MNAVDDMGVQQYDAALVDGRFRIACALKLLHYLTPQSVMFVHDFWLRVNSDAQYTIILEYYDVLGYARSLVVMRKKPHSQLPPNWETAYQKYLHKMN